MAKNKLKRFFFLQENRCLYVYASGRAEAASVARKSGYPIDIFDVFEDLEPWETSLFEGRTAPGG